MIRPALPRWSTVIECRRAEASSSTSRRLDLDPVQGVIGTVTPAGRYTETNAHPITDRVAVVHNGINFQALRHELTARLHLRPRRTPGGGDPGNAFLAQGCRRWTRSRRHWRG
jgi:hypothetical protein